MERVNSLAFLSSAIQLSTVTCNGLAAITSRFVRVFRTNKLEKKRREWLTTARRKRGEKILISQTISILGLRLGFLDIKLYLIDACGFKCDEMRYK